jgi:hypothetical protein
MVPALRACGAGGLGFFRLFVIYITAIASMNLYQMRECRVLVVRAIFA